MPAKSPNFTVTPYAVEGDIDYEKLCDRFGATVLTDEQIDRFPDPVHPLVRRRVFYAGRDVDRYLGAIAAGEQVSIVTGRGPSGPMHLGHALPFYFAKYLQEQTGASIYIPLSDDEKYLTKNQSFGEIRGHTRENLKDLLAVGFDPERTRFVVDTMDADVVYPLAASFAKHVTPATVEAAYGEPDNIGLEFYPAVQTAHLLLPQLVHGRHATLVPIAVDQDPHIRVCRDIAGKQRYDVDKPAALLSTFIPRLSGPGKMSSSGDEAAIYLTDDRETVFEKVHRYAYSGGRTTVAEHRKHGGDPEVDVSFQLLRSLFEPDDEQIDRLAADYRAGDLLSGELKELAAERIADFLGDHQARRAALGALDAELTPFRLTDDEREAALGAVGLEN